MDKKVYITRHSHSLKRIIWPNFIYFRSFLLPVKASILCLFWFVTRCQQLEDGVFILLRDGSSVFTALRRCVKTKIIAFTRSLELTWDSDAQRRLDLKGQRDGGDKLWTVLYVFHYQGNHLWNAAQLEVPFCFCLVFICCVCSFFSNINCLFLRLLTLLSL